MGRFDTTYDPNSPTEEWKRQRGRLGFAMWPDQMTGQSSGIPACRDCGQPQVVKGQQNYICRHCGQETPIKPPEPQQKKLVQKHGTAKSGGPTILSDNPSKTGSSRRRKTKGIDGSELDDDIKRDLEGFGYQPED